MFHLHYKQKPKVACTQVSTASVQDYVEAPHWDPSPDLRLDTNLRSADLPRAFWLGLRSDVRCQQ